jgi:lipid-A-disaccharide synthase
MRIAKWAKINGIKTHYYISPQIWAWKENRIKAVKRDFDKLYVILPFEKDFYENKHNFPVEFVGHPLIDDINNRKLIASTTFRKENNLEEKPIIAILPGSRKQEITKMLSVMLGVVDDFTDYQFVIAGAPSQDYALYEPFLKSKNVHFIANKTYDLLSHSAAALVTSGTATLETALFKVPEVVCYKGSWASYQIAKRIITLKYISLVNLIMDEEVVTELIQDECNSKNICVELKKILEPNNRNELLKKYSINNFDLLLIDAEGYDCHIVNDFFLKVKKIRPIIIFEWSHIKNIDLENTLDKIIKNNYSFFPIGDDIFCFPIENNISLQLN